MAPRRKSSIKESQSDWTAGRRASIALGVNDRLIRRRNTVCSGGSAEITTRMLLMRAVAPSAHGLRARWRRSMPPVMKSSIADDENVAVSRRRRTTSS